MTRRFVVGANPVSADEEKAIRDWIEKKGDWWHWIDGFWLIIDRHDELTTSEIHDKFRELAPNARVLVIEVEHIRWTGFGPGGKERNMFTWLKDSWDKD